MDFNTQVKSRTDIRRHGIQRIRQNYRRRQRNRQLGKQCFAKSCQIGMREWSLELSDTNRKLFFQLYIEPRLLQQRSSTCSSIDGQIESDFSKSLAGKAKYGIRNGKTRIGNIILVISFIQAFIIIPIEISTRLYQQIRLENKVTFLCFNGKTFSSGQWHYTILRIFLMLRHSGQRQNSQHGNI